MNTARPSGNRPLPILTLALRIGLCLALVLVGAYGAMACDLRAGLVPVVICDHDGGQSTLWLDAEGNPATPGQGDCAQCPDCLTADAAATLPKPGAAPVPQTLLIATVAFTGPALAPDRPEVPQTARGPPCAAPL